MDYAKQLPHWRPRKNRGAWRGVINQHYWHEKHGFRVICVKRGKYIEFSRACEKCGKATRGIREAFCPALSCGGKRRNEYRCDQDQCINQGRYRYEGSLLCEKHFYEKNPLLTIANQCSFIDDDGHRCENSRRYKLDTDYYLCQRHYVKVRPELRCPGNCNGIRNRSRLSGLCNNCHITFKRKQRRSTLLVQRASHE
jgi:hypothetical protein